MCGRIVQSSGPLRSAIVEGMNVRDSRVSNYPPRWNGAPSQELLVIRRNHQTGQVALDPLRWGLIPYWLQGPYRRTRAPADISGGIPEETLHPSSGWVLRVEGHQGTAGQAAL